MTELKRIVAKNITTLRVAAHLTQFELGEKLSYSDKAVSRWERGEAIPDAYVLLEMAEIFGVTVDFILKSHDEEEFLPKEEAPVQKSVVSSRTRRLVTSLVFLGVWALALIVFVIGMLFKSYLWLAFIYAIPTSLLVMFILNCLWGKRLFGVIYLSAMVWGLLLSLHLSTLSYANSWVLYLIGIPAQIIIPSAFCFSRSNKEKQG